MGAATVVAEGSGDVVLVAGAWWYALMEHSWVVWLVRWRPARDGAVRWSGAVAETVAAVEGVDELGGPWPPGCEAKSGLAAGAHDQAGGVQERVAESFRFGAGEVTVEAQVLAPDEQVVSDEGGCQPGLVDREVG